MTKRFKTVLAVAGSIIALLAVVLIWFYRTQTVWIESAPYHRVSSAPAKTLVVVYSRTGNTLSAAKEVAKYFDADLLKIEAPQYGRNFAGQELAAKDADNEVTTTPIQHDAVDLSNYDLIFLCSPTWWYRPAVPLWSFVENHDFAGKSVFLIMTGNSRLTKERTGKFGPLVKTRNGNFLDILFVRRGRVFWQKSPAQVNNEVIDALKMHKKIHALKMSE